MKSDKITLFQNLIKNGVFYQLDLITPGSSPFKAILRKHMRQIPNFLKKALGLPQIGHLV